MKKIYTILLLIVVSTSIATAQNSKTKKADQLYDRLAYTDAAEAYQKLLKKGEGSKYVFERLANSYYYINDTKKAEPYYKRVVKGKKVAPELMYNYAQCLKANGKIGDYNTWMQKFAEEKPADSRAVEFMKNPNYVPQMIEAFALFEAKNLADINSEYSEFGGLLVGKDFYFSSARNTSRKKYDWNEQPFLDVYKAEMVGTTIKNATLLGGDVNTKYHEGNVTVTADGKRMYFDRNDYFKGKFEKNEDGVNQINIYYTEKIDGNWKGVFSVPFNNSEYSVGHPALSPDGNTLYFVSDMPGGKGDSDIYKVSIDTKGNFGKPERLGDNINTEGKEVFPYVDSNGALYFSSNGHQGLGGLDGFYAEANGSNFKDPINLGNGANSVADDFAFNYNPNTKTGFMSSNRKGGKGSDDIYMISAIEAPCVVTINSQVLNEYTKGPISGARVDLYDTSENKLSTKTTDANGKVSFEVECDKAYVVQAVATDYESNAVTTKEANKTTITTTVALKPIEEIIADGKVILNPIFFDYNKHNIKSQAAFELDKLVSIMKKYPEMVIKAESHTDNRGKDAYNLNLSERRAQATVQYVISKGIAASRITGQGFGESKPINNCGDNCSEKQHQENRRSEFIIVK
ncbi:OmpA family protein [Ulvibacter litoralis]|uniref:WD40-like Beta Propeller Repeat n=1 Tax=Ulvibacter litoralis TaxID=227084 RepID=A0A1G7CYY0_9FLAO|nr:OmpA family protein [Ulvibacter litoralis]GHC45530.1 cell envelope biogenesis protein OmpA [Ulvibacter litoralis]SDE44471.1 WD40-like Beta Propeller Repeat [Ulvibacter litoralis]